VEQLIKACVVGHKCFSALGAVFSGHRMFHPVLKFVYACFGKLLQEMPTCRDIRSSIFFRNFGNMTALGMCKNTSYFFNINSLLSLYIHICLEIS
jgi:hypothetical protein